MLMSRSRSFLLLAALMVPALMTTTACNKSKPKPEVRLARTSMTSADASGANGLGTGADAANGGFSPAGSWSPSGAPAESTIGADGSMSMGARNGIKQTSNTGTIDASGTLANSASTDGVEGAQFASELTMIHFEYDSFEIAEAWKQTLNEHAAWINSNPEMMVQIEGHCDERGTEEYNMSLGQQRADAVRTYLVEQGVDANRLSTISWGKTRPLSYDQTAEAHGLNRRAMFLVYKGNNNTLASAPAPSF